MAEKTFFAEGGVTITQSRVMVKGDTYSLANITSCKPRTSLETDQRKSFLKKAAVAVGIIIGIAIGVSAKNFWVGLIVAILAIIGARFIKDKYKLYKVYLGSASGETEALKNKDEHFIDQVVRAINEAIISRG